MLPRSPNLIVIGKQSQSLLCPTTLQTWTETREACIARSPLSSVHLSVYSPATNWRPWAPGSVLDAGGRKGRTAHSHQERTRRAQRTLGPLAPSDLPALCPLEISKTSCNSGSKQALMRVQMKYSPAIHAQQQALPLQST